MTNDAVCTTCGDSKMVHRTDGKCLAYPCACEAFKPREEPAADAVAAARLDAYTGNLTLSEAVFTEPRSGLRGCRVCARVSSSRAHTDECPVPALIAAAQAEAPRVAELEAALRELLDALDDSYSGFPGRVARAHTNARALAPSAEEGGEA